MVVLNHYGCNIYLAICGAVVRAERLPGCKEYLRTFSVSLAGKEHRRDGAHLPDLALCGSHAELCQVVRLCPCCPHQLDLCRQVGDCLCWTTSDGASFHFLHL